MSLAGGRIYYISHNEHRAITHSDAEHTSTVQHTLMILFAHFFFCNIARCESKSSVRPLAPGIAAPMGGDCPRLLTLANPDSRATGVSTGRHTLGPIGGEARAISISLGINA